MKKTFKFRLKANKETIARAEEVLNLCRILYNLCLEQRKNVWRYHHKSISATSQMLQLTDLKKAFPAFAKVPSQSLQDVIQRLDKSFQGFFRRIKSSEKPGFLVRLRAILKRSLFKGRFPINGISAFLLITFSPNHFQKLAT